MKTALEIGREGVQYDAEGAYSTAFDRYEAALQSIIPILNKEPKGRRKDLLHQQVGDPLFEVNIESVIILIKNRQRFGWIGPRIFNSA